MGIRSRDLALLGAIALVLLIAMGAISYRLLTSTSSGDGAASDSGSTESVQWTVTETVTKEDGSVELVDVTKRDGETTSVKLGGNSSEDALGTGGASKLAEGTEDKDASPTNIAAPGGVADPSLAQGNSGADGLVMLQGVVLLGNSRSIVPGARVELSLTTFGGRQERAVASTDSRGAFSFAVPRSASGAVKATVANRSGTTTFTIGSGAADYSVIIRLAEPATIVGHVFIGNTSQSVPGALVVVKGADDAPMGEFMADQSGTYRTIPLPAGTYSLEARHPSIPEATGTATATIASDAIEKTLVDIRLAGDQSLEGLVIDEQTNPIPDARVTWYRSDIPQSEPVTTDAEGRFIIGGIYPSTVLRSLTVAHKDYDGQTRSSVRLNDGAQTFVLKRKAAFTLVVQWSDGTPVSEYAYRLLEPGQNRTTIDIGRNDKLVDSPDGRTTLKDLTPGDWRIEVAILDENGVATSLRNAQDFQIAPGEDTREVVVKIDGGGSVRGVVRLNDASGPPVPGARISFVPPTYVGGSSSQPGNNLNIPDALTDEHGAFLAVGIAPGDYKLVIERDDLVSDGPVPINVPPTGQTDPLTIIVRQGAVLYGVVRDSQGGLDAGADIQAGTQNASGTAIMRFHKTTDAEGRYRFDGLWPGVYFIHVRSRGVYDSRELPLEPGEQRELNFEPTDKVLVTGHITLNGRPAKAGEGNLTFANATVRRGTGSTDDQGSYTIALEAGTYNISYFHRTGSEGRWIHVDDMLAVPPGQRETSKDIDIELVDAEVIVDFPDGTAFKEGSLKIAPRSSVARYNFLSDKISQANRYVPGLTRGEYMVTYTSKDQKWGGDSGWVSVGKSEENRFYITAAPTDTGVVVYKWGPGDLSTSYQTVSGDVTPVVRDRGTLDVTVRYQNGRCAVMVESVELFQDGQRIAVDRHDAWSGFDQVNIRYQLPVSDYREDARYEARISIRADGGVDSEGSVYAQFR